MLHTAQATNQTSATHRRARTAHRVADHAPSRRQHTHHTTNQPHQPQTPTRKPIQPQRSAQAAADPPFPPPEECPTTTPIPTMPPTSTHTGPILQSPRPSRTPRTGATHAAQRTRPDDAHCPIRSRIRSPYPPSIRQHHPPLTAPPAPSRPHSSHGTSHTQTYAPQTPGSPARSPAARSERARRRGPRTSCTQHRPRSNVRRHRRVRSAHRVADHAPSRRQHTRHGTNKPHKPKPQTAADPTAALHPM
jgi:hypothetical protein